jgi:hypothetical protein
MRPASGIKILHDFGECVDASEERQIVRRYPPEHEASRLQPVCAVRQSHVEMVISTSFLSAEFKLRHHRSPWQCRVLSRQYNVALRVYRQLLHFSIEIDTRCEVVVRQ